MRSQLGDTAGGLSFDVRSGSGRPEREVLMPRIIIATLVMGALVVAGAFATGASADQVYHTERLDFSLTAAGAAAGHPQLLAGQVVNIHPNGPVNGALEHYMISGAKPNTGYEVVLEAFLGGCAGPLALNMTTASLQTNGNGTAVADASFSAQDLAPFSGLTVGAQWTLTAAGVDAYQTLCTTVVID